MSGTTLMVTSVAVYMAVAGGLLWWSARRLDAERDRARGPDAS